MVGIVCGLLGGLVVVGVGVWLAASRTADPVRKPVLHMEGSVNQNRPFTAPPSKRPSSKPHAGASGKQVHTELAHSKLGAACASAL